MYFFHFKDETDLFSKNSEDVKQTYDADGFRYYINEKSEAVITRYIGGESNVVVPSTAT